jgi:hypothetical protein
MVLGAAASARPSPFRREQQRGEHLDELLRRRQRSSFAPVLRGKHGSIHAGAKFIQVCPATLVPRQSGSAPDERLEADAAVLDNAVAPLRGSAYQGFPLDERLEAEMRRLALATILVVALAGFATGPAAASPPKTASGTFSLLSDAFTPIRDAGANSFFLEQASPSYAGDLVGVASDVDVFVARGDYFRAHGTETCTDCTIGGRGPGDFTAVFTYEGASNATGFTYSGHLTFLGGTGGLSGLHGGGTFSGNEAASNYSYSYFFTP